MERRGYPLEQATAAQIAIQEEVAVVRARAPSRQEGSPPRLLHEAIKGHVFRDRGMRDQNVPRGFTAIGRDTGEGVPVLRDQWYDLRVSSKLSATNPYLRDPLLRERMVLRSVASSSAIEGIRAPFQKTASTPAKSVAGAPAGAPAKTASPPPDSAQCSVNDPLEFRGCSARTR
jgi:hypothetical protein